MIVSTGSVKLTGQGLKITNVFTTLRHESEQVFICLRYNCTFHDFCVKWNKYLGP